MSWKWRHCIGSILALQSSFIQQQNAARADNNTVTTKLLVVYLTFSSQGYWFLNVKGDRVATLMKDPVKQMKNFSHISSCACNCIVKFCYEISVKSLRNGANSLMPRSGQPFSRQTRLFCVKYKLAFTSKSTV